MKKRVITFTEKLENEIISFQESEGLPSFTEAVRFAVKLGIMKRKPAYTASKKTEAEKLLEKREAEKLAEKLEREDFIKKVQALGGYVCDKQGNQTNTGDYYKYVKYSVAKYVQPPQILVNNMQNHASEIDFDLEKQFTNTSLSELIAIIEGGNYTVDSKSDAQVSLLYLKNIQ